MQPVIIVQGGAGNHLEILKETSAKERYISGIKSAAKAGYDVLINNGNAIDTVIAAVSSMEDNTVFNAGRGSCLTVLGNIEMDASVQDGSTLNAGGVACIENVKNPVRVAHLVMEKTNHCLLVGKGAYDFAKSQNADLCDVNYLITDRAKKRLIESNIFEPSRKLEFPSLKEQMSPDDHDTVGAVAIDFVGNVAYATSTGGINAKLVGRCGDSPLVGSGGYADNAYGACSTTGNGEAFMKVCLAKHTMFFLGNGKSAQEAVDLSLKYMNEKTGGTGGMICIGHEGDVGIGFITQGMSWAFIKDEEIHYGILHGEHFQEKL